MQLQDYQAYYNAVVHPFETLQSLENPSGVLQYLQLGGIRKDCQVPRCLLSCTKRRSENHNGNDYPTAGYPSGGYPTIGYPTVGCPTGGRSLSCRRLSHRRLEGIPLEGVPLEVIP